MKVGKRRLRRFVAGELNHVYQRTLKGFNIFYDRYDYLLYYTVFSVLSRCYGLTVLGLCLMENHIHSLIQTENKDSLSRFMDHCSSVFVREYNFSIGRKGALLQKRFGSAPKIGSKKMRTAIAYLFNNPVEKLLTDTAECYRWNFLAYAQSSHPFSKDIPNRKMSRALKRAVQEVDAARAVNNHLKYNQLKRFFSCLSEDEVECLTDYIIVKYSPFDYEHLISHYGSYQNLLIAVNSNTGSEYDIKEEFNPFSDIAYDKMKRILTEMGFSPVRSVIMLSSEEKFHVMKYLHAKTDASSRQIAKFLHLNLNA